MSPSWVGPIYVMAKENMNKIIIIILISVVLFGCGQTDTNKSPDSISVESVDQVINEQPLHTDWGDPFGGNRVYVPPGSAIKYLGELFVQLQINGGVHIGPSFANCRYKWGFDEKTQEMKGSRPGDPDYCEEFLCKAGSVKELLDTDSVKEVLDEYCKGKNIFWKVHDNTVNMFTGDARPGKENLLDIPLGTVKFEQGFTLFAIMSELCTVINKKRKKEKEKDINFVRIVRNTYRSLTYNRKVLPDYRNVMDSNFRLTRSYVFKDKTARYILNTLLRPFPFIVWIFIEFDDQAYFTVGSWHQTLQESTITNDFVKNEIILACKTKLLAGGSYLRSPNYSSRFREALMKTYADYKKDPENVLKRIDKEISEPNYFYFKPIPKTKEEIQVWKDLKTYLQKPFSEFKALLCYW